MSILQKFEAKLAAAKPSGNVPFSSRELQEHSEANLGAWKLMNEEPNRMTRRQGKTKANQKWYMRNIGNAIANMVARIKAQAEYAKAVAAMEEQMKAQGLKVAA